ncbi:efflux RND transporter periplasmic adaptor subunit [Pedobacter sp. JY14-1]|uniref:efflux RND transporter periplasmic adaptor subunit n=1 Tax=Pedobacter sp. JY14-1 TaxID=3034151 RepID=UPI0023E33D35|nr:efflux RND transporter periplasmic adaptor subunit [Pedobacter sp. JY14-1]
MTRNMYPLSRIIGLLAVVTALLLPGCSGKQQETPKDDKFIVTDSLVSKLQTDTVKGAGNRAELNLSAKITPNEEKTVNIYPMVSGVVQSVPAKRGDKVSKGQLLATMTSGDMAGFDKEVISSSAELKNAQRNLQLAKDMYDSGLASARDLEQARNDLMIKEAEDKRTRAVLSLNGGSKNGVYSIRSPLSGFIIDKNISDHMQVRPDNTQNLFTVTDLSTVWALINVYESDIAKISEGDEVDISILSYPDRPFRGRISKIYNVLDADSKVMNARVVIDNPESLLKPGMMASVRVAAKNRESLPVVSSDCLIFDSNRYYVVMLDPVKKLRIQEVKLGRKFEDKAYIARGLKPGDRVVKSRQLFLYDSLK